MKTSRSKRRANLLTTRMRTEREQIGGGGAGAVAAECDVFCITAKVCDIRARPMKRCGQIPHYKMQPSGAEAAASKNKEQKKTATASNLNCKFLFIFVFLFAQKLFALTSIVAARVFIVCCEEAKKA